MKRTLTLRLSLLLFAVGLFAWNLRLSFAAGALTLAVLALADIRSIRPAGGLRFWAFALAFAFLPPFFFGDFDCKVLGRNYSTIVLMYYLAFVFHAYVFMSILAFAGRNYSLNEIVAYAENWGFRTLGLRIALALSGLKIIRRQTQETLRQYCLTRRTTGAKLRDLDLLAAAAARNCAATAERISVLFYLRGVKI